MNRRLVELFRSRFGVSERDRKIERKRKNLPFEGAGKAFFYLLKLKKGGAVVKNILTKVVYISNFSCFCLATYLISTESKKKITEFSLLEVLTT